MSSRAPITWGVPLGAGIALLVLVVVFGGLAFAGVISSRVALYGVVPVLCFLVASSATVLVLRRRQQSTGRR